MDGLLQKEIALKFMVSARLVQDLVSDAGYRPDKLRSTIEKAKLGVRKLKAICKVTRALQEEGEHILNV